MAQIGVQSTLVLVSSESGFEGCDLDEMSSVEYLVVALARWKIGCYRKVAKLNWTLWHHFSGTSFVVIRKYGGSSGANSLIHEIFTTSGYRGMVT